MSFNLDEININAVRNKKGILLELQAQIYSM